MKRYNSRRPIALTVAGSDPGGGAGIQADLKTFAALGVYGYSALTEVIAQNSARVLRVTPVQPAMVRAQLEALVAERRPDAMKTGALGTAGVVKAVARALVELRLPAPVVDPVMVSSSGTRLLDRRAERTLRDELLPLAVLVTPNIPEAEALSGVRIVGRDGAREAALRIAALGARAVVIKGGHLGAGSRASDFFFDGRRLIEITGPRLAGPGAHGTGCAFSAAVAAHLALGADLESAVRRAKRFVLSALKRSFKFGRGRPLLDHFALR
jgi:hydroxymethylpyrimidine/phosphomethylpyrimidine kinase